MTIAMPDPGRNPGGDARTGPGPAAAVSAAQARGGCRVAGRPILAMPMGRRGGLAAGGDPALHGVALAGRVRRRVPLGGCNLPALRRLDGGGQ